MEHKCSILVQLYTLSEGERVRGRGACGEGLGTQHLTPQEDSGVYWPPTKETTLSVGPFQITQDTISTHNDFTVRTLHVLKSPSPLVGDQGMT